MSEKSKMKLSMSDPIHGDLSTQEIMEKEAKFVVQTYARLPISIVRGSGVVVWDAEGREYLDLVAGIAVNSVGHCHPTVVQAIADQAQRLIHTSNLYYTQNQVLLAEELCGLTGLDRAFFCNSGAESVEAALKLARRATGKSAVVAAQGSFHGRTLGALGTTYKAAYREPFRPLSEADFVSYSDPEALKAAVTRDTGAVILEPVQGEAGVHVPPIAYLRAARDICDDNGALLIFDEVQTGFGRTGRWFAKEHSGVVPDMMTLAKAVAGGLPMGVMMAKEEVASRFQKGDHGTTFGGGPLICAAALATIRAIRDENLVQRSEEMGDYLRASLKNLNPVEIRGLGLMVGLDIKGDARATVSEALKQGVILNATGDQTLRLVPPLVVTADQIDRVVKVLGEILG